MEAASSDASSLGTDGPEARWWTWEPSDVHATTAMGCMDEADCTAGSIAGVDDHAIKFPLVWESVVWTGVTC